MKQKLVALVMATTVMLAGSAVFAGPAGASPTNDVISTCVKKVGFVCVVFRVETRTQVKVSGTDRCLSYVNYIPGPHFTSSYDCGGSTISGR